MCIRDSGYGYGYGYGETDDLVDMPPMKSKSNLATLPFPAKTMTAEDAETSAKFAAIGSGSNEERKAV